MTSTIIADLILPNNSQIQDPYSNFQVQPQQVHVDLEKDMKFMIQSQNDCIQSQTDCLKSPNKLEAKVSHLVNIINDRNEESLCNTFSTIPYSPSHIDEESWYFENFNQDSISPQILDLTNINPLLNWQVFILMRLNLKMNVTSILNVMIQFHFLNLC